MREKLVEIQLREGLTDGQMAEKLGVSRPMWNLVKNGRLRFTERWALRAAGAFPELSRELLELAYRIVRTDAPAS